MTEVTAASRADSDLSGRVFGDYRILRRLGRGAMAEVYLAEQSSLRRQVAIKILLPQLAADSNYIERFRLEAQAAASLVHANIVQIYEVGQRDGLHYIAQEYVPGQNLKEFVARHGPLSEKQAVAMMLQVASALNKAASQGIVHRDIKPENIMLSTSGEVKVADFGLARVLADTALNLTQVGVTLGTPLYMSPEQVEGRPLDPRSDLYSLGVTFYHMLAGRPPFESETALGVAVQHVNAQPQPLESLRPDLPPQLAAIIMRLLSKDRNHRFPTARELIHELNVLKGPGNESEDLLLGVAEASPTRLDRGPLTAATQRLQTALVRRQAISADSINRRRLKWSLPAVAAALAAGILLAWSTRQPFLLAEANPARTHVARQESAIDQLFYASTLNTEEAWLAVREHFPEAQFYCRLADQQLARLYLYQNDYQRAAKLFSEFASLDETEESFRAFGLAGLCVVYSLQGDPQRSAETLNQLYPLRRYLDPQMARLVQRAVERNHQALNPNTVKDWDTWYQTQHASDEV
jgi:serine/threonine-protein kinase